MRGAALSLLLVTAAVVAATSAVGGPPALRPTNAATVKQVPAKPVVAAVGPVAVKHVVVKRVVARRVAVRRPAIAHGISVPMDEVRVVQFSSAISTVYVGNPTIADVSMIDSRHAFVLGKGFGATNLVALDADGKQVVNDPVSVYGRTGNTVTLQRGASQVTYACAGVRCESAPMPGDDKESFETRTGQLEKHQDMGAKAASEGH